MQQRPSTTPSASPRISTPSSQPCSPSSGDPSVDATNWRAEQAIRPAVVTRKVCGGNRTRHGADTQQALASVVRTAHQRNLDLTPLIATMLRTPNPTVPDGLQRPPPHLQS